MSKQVFYLNAPQHQAVDVIQAGGKLDLKLYEFVAETDEEDVFRAMNVVNGDELPARRGLRSMSVGDVYLDGEAGYFCLPSGWYELARDEVEGLRRLAALGVLEGRKVEVGW